MVKPTARLRSYWDKKLAESGFIDIEEEINGERVLKQSSQNVYRNNTKDGKLEYFTIISQKIIRTKFETDLHEKVMRAYSEGVKRAVIEKAISKDRKTIYHIIDRYLKEWGLKAKK